MAKRRRKNFSKYVKGAIDTDLSLTTLAAKTPVSETTNQTVVDTARVSTIEAVYTLADFTPGANIGPIAFGVMHSDYTDAELEAWLESSGSWDLGNMVERENRSRRIRQIGVFNSPTLASDSSRHNDGRMTKTKLNWVLTEGDGLSFWCYNLGNQPVATTVPNFNVLGHANIWYN